MVFLIPAPSAAACKILPEDLINLTSEPVKWPQSAKKDSLSLYSSSIGHSLMELLVVFFLLPLWMVSRNSSYLSLVFSFKPKSMAHSSGKLLYSNFRQTIILSPSLSFILVHHGFFSMKMSSLSLAICISPIIHLVAPKFSITFAFNFPWVLQVSQ